MNKFFLLTVFFFCKIILLAQLPPLDKNWDDVNVNKSDDFDDGIINTQKWQQCQGSWGMYEGKGGLLNFNCAYCYESNGFLTFMAEPKSNGVYNSGGVQSKNPNYSYGYFEISAKLPGFYKIESNPIEGGIGNGIPCGEGFWPAFWTYYIEDVANTNCPPPPNTFRIKHDEIDILEPDGSQYINANRNVAGWHDETGDCHQEYAQTYKVSGDIILENLPPLFITEHKYSCEWLEDRIILYFDKEPFYYKLNPTGNPNHNQYVVIDFQIDGRHLPSYSTPWPQYMKINYFHYYQLKYSCTEDAHIYNNDQLENFQYSVKRSIILGNNTETIDIVQGTYVFRASEELRIYGEFNVNLGAELYLVPTPCN